MQTYILDSKLISDIKEALKSNFSVSLDTVDRSWFQIAEDDEILKKFDIIHYFDKVSSRFWIFNNREDMNKFYNELKEKYSILRQFN